MNKDNKNRRKATIGAVIAAGVTTGAIAACASNEAKPVQSEKPEVELTAADKVVVDGQEIDSTQMLPVDTGRRGMVKPMYGVRQRPINLMYGPRPRPRPGMNTPDSVNSVAAIERGVMEVVSTTLGIEPMNVQVSSRLAEDFKITSGQRERLKQALEMRYGIKIYDETFDAMRTVGDLVNCVCVMVRN